MHNVTQFPLNITWCEQLLHTVDWTLKHLCTLSMTVELYHSTTKTVQRMIIAEVNQGVPIFRPSFGVKQKIYHTKIVLLYRKERLI